MLAGLRGKMSAMGHTIKAMARHSELDVTTIFDQALTHVAQALPGSMICLHLLDADAQSLNLVASHGLDPVRSRSWAKLTMGGSSAQAQAQRNNQPVEWLGHAAPSGMKGLICLPLGGFDVRIGVLSAAWDDDGQPPDDPDMVDFLQTMGTLLAVAIEHYGLVSEMVDNISRIMELKSLAEERSTELDDLNQRLRDANQRLTELSITDGLTSVYNHRYINQRIEEEIHRCERSGDQLSLVMADLDHFKGLNDSLGHLAGDEALRQFARWMRGCVRSTDMVGRLGGEEFVVALLNCPLDQAVLVAEKIRRVTETNSKVGPFAAIGGFHVSLGVTQWRKGQDLGQLVDEVDRALYKAKNSGRNRVCASKRPRG